MEFFLLAGGIMLLQYFLSIQKKTYLGWILPILALIGSIFYTFYFQHQGNEQPIYLTLIYGNIPTLVLICIRFASKDLDKLTSRKR